jgi:hypothetical protein
MRQHPTVAIKNLAAGWCQQANIDAVLFGQQAKLIRLVDLQIAHARRKRTNKPELHPPQQQGTAAQLAVGAFLIFGRASHLRASRISASAAESLRTPKRL